MRGHGAARSRTSPVSTRPTSGPRLPTSASIPRKRARSRPRIRSLTNCGGAASSPVPSPPTPWPNRQLMSVDSVALDSVIAAARAGGEAVLDAYERGGVGRIKADGSPVSGADERSQEIILAHLAEIAPGLPVVAEEGKQALAVPGSGRFWLVDPLDGTKEFLN